MIRRVACGGRSRVCAAGIDALIQMIFVDNFVHGDLHPGNIFVVEDTASGEAQLAYLDAGIAVSYSDADHEHLIDVLTAFIQYDGYEVGRLMASQSSDKDKLVDVVLSLEMEARGLRDASAKADEAAATADARSVQAINEVQAGCSQAATMALTRARAAKAAAAEAARAEIDAVSAAVEAMREAAQATKEADEA